MEATAKQELECRLGSLRRPVPADSTAGVSLSGLTESSPGEMELRFLEGAQTGLTRSQNTRTEADIAMEKTAETQSSLQSSEVVNVAPLNMNIGLTASNYTGTALQAEEVTLLDSRNTPLISTMVFHCF